MIDEATLDLWERIATQQAFHEGFQSTLALPFLTLIKENKRLQGLVDKFNEPEAARRKTATLIDGIEVNSNGR